MRDSRRRPRRDDRPPTGHASAGDGATPHELQVLVVGDGVGGLVLAGLLLNRGIRPVVVGGNAERPRPGGAVLPPVSVAMLDELLLDVSVRAAGRTLRRWTLHGPDGRVRAREASAVEADRAGVMLSRSEFRRALLESLPARVVRPETVPARIGQSRPSVEVEFEDGVREQFDLVVAADGRCSSVRSAASERPAAGGERDRTEADLDSGTSPAPDDRPETVTWTVETDESVGTPTEVTEVWSGESVLTSLPLESGNVVSLSVPAAHCAGPTPTGVVESLTATVDCLPEDAAVRLSTDATARRDAVGGDAWRVRRVAFLGDATHAVAPLPGAATPLAIEEASTLADAIDRCDGPDDALATYAARRRARVDGLRTRVPAVSPDSPTPPPNLGAAVRARAGLFAGYFDADP